MPHDDERRPGEAPATTPEGASPLEPAAPAPSAAAPSSSAASSSPAGPSASALPSAPPGGGREAVARAVGDDPIARTAAAVGGRPPLLEHAERYRQRWDAVRADFVDEPRRAVARADELLGDVVHELGAALTREREALEARWDAGDDPSTEELRVVLLRYRTRFEQLLAE